jgi:hypothetical protein
MGYFYIKAKVIIGVRGISGNSQEGVSYNVNASNVTEAKRKFEDRCREKFAAMNFNSMEFDYLEIAFPIL